MDKSRLRNMTSTGSDRTRLIVMTVLLALAVAAFLGTRNSGSRSAIPAPTRDGLQPAGAGESAPPAAAVDVAELASVADDTEAQRLTRDQQPFLHLLMESAKLVPGDFRRMEAQPLTDETYAAVQEDPASHRGQPYTARGFFSFAERRTVSLDLDGSGGEQLPYFQGLLQDDLGRQFTFSVLEIPEDLQPGEIVKAEGFFFKRYGLFAPEAPDQLIDGTLHLVGKRLVRSFYRMEAVHELSPTLLSTVRDYDIQDQLRIPDEVLYHLISYVQNTDADALATGAQDVTSFQLSSNPEQFRGESVRVLGTFHQTWAEHLGPSGENPLDLPVVWHGLLIHGGPTFSYVICPEREPSWVRRSTTVIAEGVFFKRYAYQTKDGKIITCPLLVVKRFVGYRVDTSSVNQLVSVVFIGLAIVLLVWFAYSALGDRRANAQYRERFIARRKARLEGMKAPGREES